MIVVNSFKPSGLYRLFAYFLGLTKFKSVSFSNEYVQLNSKKITVSINFIDVTEVRIGGILFSNFRIKSSGRNYVFRGLSKKDATRLHDLYKEAEKNGWKISFESCKQDLELLSKWIDEIKERQYFQRSSIFKARASLAEELENKFLGSIPASLGQSEGAKNLEKIRQFPHQNHQHRNNINQEYVPKETERHKKLFDAIESNPLTEEQRHAVVKDEDANLVIASAGSGKTSVIVAKAAWLIEKGLRKPGEILMLAFGSEAAKEMSERITERLPNLEPDQLKASTFHSLGYNIVREISGKPTVSDLAKSKEGPPVLEKFIQKTITEELKNSEYKRVMIRWFSEFFSPYKSEFDFKNYGEYWEYIKKNQIITLKDEQVKSYEECEVANFLYLNGINYIYEKPYEHVTKTEEKRQYLPDFYLPDYEIYIEHLGINCAGQTAPYVDRGEYLRSLEWKRELHEEYETILIETTSCEKSQGVLTKNLQDKLTEYGVEFRELDTEQILAILNERKQIDSFTKLVATFLGHFKGSQFTESSVRQIAVELEGVERNQAFLDVFMPIFESYQKALKLEDKVDYHDMIIEATNLINSGKFKSPYRYIMVDEFQDISMGRAKLLSALQKSDPDVQLFCVGDDWQAIYRFTGSDINIMKNFGEHFGTYARSDLGTTFRCEKKITDQATHFILQNDFQITKKVRSVYEAKHPSVYVCLPEKDEGDQLTSIMNLIATSGDLPDKQKKPSVLILGRYRTEVLESFTKTDYGNILYRLSKRFPQLNIKYKTVHGSKGLEADYVILLDHGFPSEKVDDPILNMVLSAPEVFPNSEERRLFYVALTRAKKKVFLATGSGKRSEFIDEVIKSPIDIEIFGKKLSDEPNCEKCMEGTLRLKEEFGFWGCKNYPYCENKEQACPYCKKGFPQRHADSTISCSVCEQQIEKCLEAGCKGFIQQRKNKTYGNFFWGCTEYSNPEKKCGYTRNTKYPEDDDKSRYKKYSKRTSQSGSNKFSRPNSFNKQYPNHGKPWKKAQNDKLKRLVTQKKTNEEIAREMGRSAKSIELQRDKLGLY